MNIKEIYFQRAVLERKEMYKTFIALSPEPLRIPKER